MLGKLLKYEFRATGRILLPAYIIMIFSGLIAGLTMGPEVGTVTTLLILIFSGVAVASIVLTIIITIQRFQNNLLADEGYLMFTLPVTTTNLISSKLIVAVVWGIVGTIAGIISGIALSIKVITWPTMHVLFNELSRVASSMVWNDWLFLVAMVVTSILSYALFVLIIYVSLSVGQLPFAGKHRKLWSIISFFVIYIVFSIGVSIIEMITNTWVFYYTINQNLFTAIGIGAIVSCILFFAIRSILNKHLNLE